jgi:hypothetical protein
VAALLERNGYNVTLVDGMYTSWPGLSPKIAGLV